MAAPKPRSNCRRQRNTRSKPKPKLQAAVVTLSGDHHRIELQGKNVGARNHLNAAKQRCVKPFRFYNLTTAQTIADEFNK